MHTLGRTAMDLPPLLPAGEAIGLSNQHNITFNWSRYVTISLPSVWGIVVRETWLKLAENTVPAELL